MSSAAVNLAGLLAIALIVWWFWLSTPRAQRRSGGVIDVIVADGVYSPARIEVPAGQPVSLRFLRKDPSPCAEQVIFDDLQLSRELPLDTPVELKLNVPAPGEYPFTCQMKMYRGTLVVR